MLFENLFYFLKKKNITLMKGSYLISYYRNFKVNNLMLNYSCALHNGRFFIPLKLTINMKNYNISTFIFTKAIDLERIPGKYEYKKKINNKKKK